MHVNKFSVARLSSVRRTDLPAGQQHCGAMREHEAQRLSGREARKRGVYARAATLLGTCVDLEVVSGLCERSTSCCQTLSAARLVLDAHVLCFA